MRKNSTDYSNFQRFMARMENEKKKKEQLYKASKNGEKKNGRNKNRSAKN